jgi:hypothetical protein
MNERKEEVAIPDSARTRCPKANFKLRQVSKCTDCPAFKGLFDRFPGGRQRFAIRYGVLCAAEPAKREIFEMEAE